MISRDDIELAFVREFQHSGNVLTKHLSTLELRERVRVLILKDQRERCEFYDYGITYADAYKVWSGSALDRRLTARKIAALDPQDDGDDHDQDDTASADHETEHSDAASAESQRSARRRERETASGGRAKNEGAEAGSTAEREAGRK